MHPFFTAYIFQCELILMFNGPTSAARPEGKNGNMLLRKEVAEDTSVYDILLSGISAELTETECGLSHLQPLMRGWNGYS